MGTTLASLYGNDQQSYGQPPMNSYYYSDFMHMIANQWPSHPIGQYARQWLNMVQPTTDPWVAAVDQGGTARAFTNLPLDYYAPGAGFLYTRSSWASTATSVFLQLSEGSNASHIEANQGSFQINSGNEQLAVEHAGYSDVFADGSLSGYTNAANGIVYNNLGQTLPGTQLGFPQVLAIESTSTFSYAAVDLTNTYVLSPDVNPNDGTTNPYQARTVREFLFIKPLNTLFVIDRLESTSSSVTQSFLLHTPQNPTIVDANHVTLTSG